MQNHNEMEKFFPKAQKINSDKYMNEHLFPDTNKIIDNKIKQREKIDLIKKPIKSSEFLKNKLIERRSFKDYQYQEIKLEERASLKASTLKLIKQGKYPIDVCIDLHGYILEHAYNKFLSAIQQSYENHHRLVLIITGKGLDDGKGLIKHNLLLWINNNYFLNKVILYISYARPQDGGEGAFYIYLKK